MNVHIMHIKDYNCGKQVYSHIYHVSTEQQIIHAPSTLIRVFMWKQTIIHATMIIDNFFPGFKGKVHLKTRLCGIGKYNGNTLNTLLLTIMRIMLTNGDISESCMNNEHTFSIPNRQRMECRGQKFTEEELRWRLGKFSQHRSYPSSLS